MCNAMAAIPVPAVSPPPPGAAPSPAILIQPAQVAAQSPSPPPPAVPRRAWPAAANHGEKKQRGKRASSVLDGALDGPYWAPKRPRRAVP
jgi:hypothetical protein